MPEETATAAEYIAALQKVHPRQPITRETAEHALDDPNAEAVDIAAVIDEINRTDYVQRLLESLSARLPENVLSLINSGTIAVGELGLPTFDARVVPVGSGHAILIHRGTHQFIYRIARILSTRFVPGEEDEPALPLEETARIIAEAFAWYLETGHAFGPEYEVTAEQRQIANMITLDAMRFLLCHEIAHVITDREASPEYKVEVDASPHLDEHGADVLGAMWALGLGSAEGIQSAWKMAARYAGIEFVLQVWAVLEQLGYEFSDSHPRAEERLEVIRLVVADKCDEETWKALTSLAEGTRQLFKRISEILQEGGQHECFVATEAAALVAELDALLDRCATIPIPDYTTFYSQAGRIFARGYPEQLMTHVELIGREFRSDADTNERWSKERVRRFQKLKLLVGYMDYLNEPARSSFRAALGLTG